MTAPTLTRGPLGYFASVFAGGLSVAFLLLALQHMNTPLLYLAYLTAMPLYLAGLGGGALAGAVATVVGTLVLYAMQPVNVAIVYTVLIGVPSLALIALLLRFRLDEDQQVYWYPEGKILTAITIYPCLLFLAALAATSDHPGGLLALTHEAFTPLAKMFTSKFGAQYAPQVEGLVDVAAQNMPALGGYAWIITTVLCIAGAQFILILNNKLNLRDRLSINDVRLPSWIIYMVAITGLFGVYGTPPYDYVGRNLSLIFGLPFLFVGVAVVQVFASTLRFKWALLIPFYLLMIVLPKLALVFVAGIGVIDQWADFRRRITRKTTV